MNWLDRFFLKVRRAETPFYARLKRVLKNIYRVGLPVPAPMRPVFVFLTAVRLFAIRFWRMLLVIFFRGPVFRMRCESVGDGLYLEQFINVSGGVRIVIGNNVTISGRFAVGGGRTVQRPELILGDRVFIGNNVRMLVSRSIVLEEGAAIAAECYLADNDGHPADAASRYRGDPVPFDEAQPIRIGRYAWVGRGSYIMKGVTIGDGAVVGVGSVVFNDVPPFSVAMGNPARVVRKNTPVALDELK